MANDELMIDSTDNFDDELLSAYVDGELTGEQLALVEQRLADDPRARQLVEELLALSQEVQSLPKETLGEDLRATILQRAERGMLLGAEGQQALRETEQQQASKGAKQQQTSKGAEQQQTSRGAEQQQTSRPSDFASSRRWVWAAMALAATLLLMVIMPNDQQQEKPQASAKPSPPGELASAGGDTPQKHPKPKTALADTDAAFVEEETTAFRSRSTSSPSRVAPSAVAIKEMPERKASDTSPAFQVHITLSEGANRFENFNQLLVNNGIELEEAEEEADENGQSGQENQAAGARVSAKSRQVRRLQESQQTVQEEVLLVEALPENIEGVLKDCSSDTFNCASVRVQAEGGSLVLSIDNLSQYERSGKQLALNQQNYLMQKKQARRRLQRGKAMRLKADQYESQPNGQLNIERKLFAKSNLASKKSAKSPVQVLFILQQPQGEPASAGGDR